MKLRLLLILSLFCTASLFAQSGNGVTITNGPPQCSNNSPIDLNDWCTRLSGVTILGWFTPDGTPIGGSVVQPQVTTQYVLKWQYGGVNYSDTATVTVYAPPFISVYTDTLVCPGNFKLKVIGSANTKTILWREGATTPVNDGTTVSFTGSTTEITSHSFVVTASNGVCPDTVVNVLIRVSKALSTNGLKMNDITTNTCIQCQNNINLLNIVKEQGHNGDSLVVRGVPEWYNNANEPVNATPRVLSDTAFRGVLSVKICVKNECGSLCHVPVGDVTVRINIKMKEDCVPRLSFGTVVDSIISNIYYTRCASVPIYVLNPMPSNIKIDPTKITFSVTSPQQGLSPEFLSNSGNMLTYRVAKGKNLFQVEATIPYTDNCDVSAPPSVHTVIANVLPSELSLDGTYCKGDTGTWAVRVRTANQELLDVDLGSNSLFKCQYFNATIFKYSTKDTVLSPDKYSNFPVKVKYVDCGDTLQPTLQGVLRHDEECQPLYSPEYPGEEPNNGRNVCIGDTMKFYVEKFNKSVKILYTRFDSSPDYRIDSISSMTSGATTTVTYRVIPKRSCILTGTIYYQENNEGNTYPIAQRITVISATPKYQLYEDCPGGMSKFVVQMTNKTSAVHTADFTTAPNTLNYLDKVEKDENNKAKYTYIFRAKTAMDLFSNISYNQGDSMFTFSGNYRITPRSDCDMRLTASKTEMCTGDTIEFKLQTPNVYDTIVDISFTPSGMKGLRISDTVRTYSTRLFQDTTITCSITVRNLGKDTILKLSVFVAVKSKPRIFTLDTVHQCQITGSPSTDLNNFISNDVVQVYWNQGSSRTVTPADVEHYAKALAISKVKCDYMNNLNEFVDSVKIKMNINPYISLSSTIPTSICKYDTIALKAYANTSVLIWYTKNPADTISKTAQADESVYTVAIDSRKYYVDAANACGVAKDSVAITVLLPPTLEVTKKELKGCLHTDVTLDVKTNYTVLLQSIQWKKDTTVINSKSATVQVESLTPYIWVVEGVDIRGCRQRDTTTIISHPLPDAHVYKTGTQDTMDCRTGSGTVNVTATGLVSYQWLHDASTQNPRNLYSDITKKFSVAGVDVNGCHDTTFFYVVIVTPPISLTDTSSCERYPFSLYADTLEGANYTWVNMHGTQYTGRLLHFDTLQMRDSGVYHLTATQWGCPSEAYPRIHVKPTPKAFVESSNAPLCEGTSFYLSAGSNIPSTLTTAHWITPENIIINNHEISIATIKHTDSGTYRFVSYLLDCYDTMQTLVRVDHHTSPAFSTDKTFYCEDDSLYLETSPVHDSIIYKWQTHTRSFSTTESNYIIPDLQAAENGTLMLIVVKFTCEDTIYDSIDVRERPLAKTSCHPQYCEKDTVHITSDSISEASYAWTGPNSFSATTRVLQFPNASPDLTGNYILKILHNECWSYPDTAKLKVFALPIINLSKYNFVCEEENLHIDIERSGGTYLWNDGYTKGTRDISWKQAGDYWVIVTENNCSKSDSTSIEMRKKPNIKLSIQQDTTICFGDELEFTTNLPDAFLTWPDDSHETYFVVDYRDTVWVNALVNECNRTSDTVFVGIQLCDQFVQPTAFYPAGSIPKNRTYKAYINLKKEFLDFKMYIYDGWGHCVFTTTDLDEGWDGQYKDKASPSGIYKYKIVARDKVFNTDLSTSGSFTLVR